MKLVALAALGLAASIALAAAPGRHVLVVCSPGSPGTTAEAQPTMDAFASALAAKAGFPAAALGAVYDETEDSGVARLREKDLALRARLQAAPKGRAAMERWTLVAKKGRVANPAALDGFTVASIAGFAPAFVRGPALASWGRLPAGVRIVQSVAVLSALRRAAAGDPMAVLLDGAQEAAFASLPFASELEVVTRSPPLPAGLIAAVDARLPAKSWSSIEAALLALPSDAPGTAALDAIQMAGFTALDGKALAAARKAYAEAAR